MTSAEPPVRVGRYVLDGVIGTGAFATVHRALDERLDDVVALKVLAENHSLNPEVRERFLTEGRVLRRVDDPHVVRVLDLGETERQQPFLVLQHADRGTLAERVAARRAAGWRPGPADVLCVARPLAAAAASLHRVGVVHRDLSPGNVLLRSGTGDDTACDLLDDGEGLLLADLGLCKDLAINSGLSAAGGTEGFRPPEQRRGPARVDARADLWALSAMLTWLVTGRAPGPGSVARAVADAGLPRALSAVLDRSLAERPEARHDDAATWLADVERAVAPPARPTASAEDAAAGPGAPDRAPAGPGGSGLLRRGAVLALLVLAGMLVGGLLTLLVPRLADGPDVVAIEGGDVRVSRSVEGATVALTGPAEVRTGQAAVFTAELDGVQEWLWIGPDGVAHAGAARLEVRTTGSGLATVRLLGVTAAGEPVQVAHQLRVTDP